MFPATQSTLGRVSITAVAATFLLQGCNRGPQYSEAELSKPVNLAEIRRQRPKPSPTPKPTMPPIPAMTAVQLATLKQAQQSLGNWPKRMAQDDEASQFNLNGIVVCEPQTGASLRDFGAGVGRWLHLNVAGQGELSCTPVWGSVADSWREMKRKDGQLNAAQAAVLARKLGVTHVATGQLSGTPARCELTYELWQMPQRRKIGNFQAAGTQSQVLSMLPTLARRMSVQIGVKSPQIPARIAANPTEVAAMGAVPWKPYDEVPKAKVQPLKVLSSREPLAGLLLLRSGHVESGQTLWRQTVGNMLKQAPNNALVWADVAWQNTWSLEPHQAQLQRVAQRYQHNYLVELAQTCWYRANNERREEHQHAVQAIRCAPRYWMAWSDLADTMGGEAQDVRQSRYSNQISSTEWKYLSTVYSHWLRAALQAARLNPDSAYAWAEVATAASFSSSSDLADAALFQALQIDPKNRDAVSWGLQMYQPKWDRDAAKLQLIVQIIEADPFLFNRFHHMAILALNASNLNAEANGLMLRALWRYGDAAKRDPKDATPHYHLAYLAKNFGIEGSQDETAITEFEKYLALNPNDASVHYDLGWMLHYKKRLYRKAETHYRAALKLSPDYADALNSLGDLTYYVHRDAAAAEKLYRRAIELENNGLYRVELARLLLDRGKRDEAMQEAKLAIAAGYTEDNDAFKRLGINPLKMQIQNLLGQL
jgi:tetratricopeptide (TPR) repeat protein